MHATLAQARALGLLDDDDELATVDSTGFETRHVSEHYLHRIGRKHRRFPKFSEVIEARSHLSLAAWCGRGPAPDQPHLRRIARAAVARHPFKALAADAGYDGESHQRYLHQRLGVIGIIPANAGRPRKDPNQPPGGFYRRCLHEHWPTQLYHQRAQSESRISMHKRRLGSHLTARRRRTQDQQMQVRSITLNFMINAVAA